MHLSFGLFHLFMVFMDNILVYLGTEGQLAWHNNWVPLLDTLLQFSLLGTKQRALMLPTRIRKVTIDPNTFLTHLQEAGEVKTTVVSKV